MDIETALKKKHIVLVPCLLRPKKRFPLAETRKERLSAFLERGRTYHSLCRNAFVEQVPQGYYAYEKRTEYRTCALAAAYAGAFGPDSVEQPEFSYTMAVWQLSQKLGFDLEQTAVSGPTGREQNLINEMLDLTDINFWTRQGVAEWLHTIGY